MQLPYHQSVEPNPLSELLTSFFSHTPIQLHSIYTFVHTYENVAPTKVTSLHFEHPCFAPSAFDNASSFRQALIFQVARSPSLPQISVARLTSPPSSRARFGSLACRTCFASGGKGEASNASRRYCKRQKLVNDVFSFFSKVNHLQTSNITIMVYKPLHFQR